MNKNYEIHPSEGHIVLKLNGVCDYGNLKTFYDDVMEHIHDPYPYLVIDCENLASISKDWVRELLRVNLFLRSLNKQMRFVQVKPDLKNEFKSLGMDDAFKITGTVRDALVDFGLVARVSLDTEFINPFLNATLNVLKIQASIEARAGKIYLKKPDEKLLGDVSGVIGIVSDSFSGAVVISFPEQTFLKVMGGMLGEEYTEMSQDILDGAGEITNMIFGQAKLSLNEKGYGIKTALPSVVSGKDHSLNSKAQGPTIVVPFQSQAGVFFVEICLSA